MVNKMDEWMKVSHKSHSTIKKKQEDKLIKYLRGLITRVLLSIILVISICIYIKLSASNKLYVSEYVFQDSLKFTQINKWYQNTLGKIIPNPKEDSTMVMENNDLKTLTYEKYLDGVKFKTEKNSPVSLLSGGIVVFIGPKEGYGNTVIIQGNDGIDYWYGGVSNTNINLYDYLEKEALIGECVEDHLYLVLEKVKNYISYEEYLKQV